MEKHYEFGDNWASYSQFISEDEISHAEKNLARLVGNISGKRFLDIGCGSGLHSLAALNLGAESVTCIDYDLMSVETTQKTLERFAPTDKWHVSQDDILKPKLEGKFDVVYSWGVLHHTGDMMTAIEHATHYCDEGGKLIIALYVKTPFCGFWTKEKRVYTYYPFLRPFIRIPYSALLYLRQAIATGKPLGFLKDYKQMRGMNFWTDIEDWLGGYPYESISDHAFVELMDQKGFTLEQSFQTESGLGLFGTGCGEWVFLKK